MALTLFFRSDWELKDIVIRYDPTISKEYAEQEWAYRMGKLPYLFIPNPESDGGGLPLDHNDILKMKLYNDGFLPRLDVIFRDPLNKVITDLYPTDKSFISFFKKSESDLLMPIRIDFIINNFRAIKEREGDNTEKIYSLTSELLFNNITENVAYKGTSFAVLQSLAQKSKLGFASNIDNTEDEMIWINTGMYISEFIQDTTKNSYKSDETFMVSFIDLYYNLNYIDIEKQLAENSWNEKSVAEYLVLVDEENIHSLVLSNHPNFLGTNLYIDKYNLDNTARFVNFEIGYQSKILYYDKTDIEVVNDELDIITNEENKIVLKNFKKEENYRQYNLGKQDQDNVHKKFLYSRKLNENNLDYLQKVKMNIILNIPNMSLYRFQNVQLVLFEQFSFTDSDIKEKKASDKYKINDKLSGEWLITGINYIYDIRTGFSQEITLAKRELTKIYDKEKLENTLNNMI